MDSEQRPLSSIDEAFERAPCGLLATTVDGMIVRVNSTFCGWVGYQAQELLEKRRIQDLLTIGGKVFHQTHWAPLLQMQRSVAEVKVDMIHRDGQKVPMLINAARRRHGDVEYNEFAVLVVIDRHQYERELLRAREKAEVALEEKRVAEEALREADRRKDAFMATLAHELRNPLAPMRNVVDLLRLKNFADPQLLWARDVLDRQMVQMTHLVDGLLEVSRISEGKITLRRESLDLATALKYAAEACQSIVAAASHTLTVELPHQPVFINADPTRFSQIVQNLLNNAAKYTPDGGAIWLTGRREGEQAVISVRDNGIGIATEHLPSLFEMFSQLGAGLERSQGGLGIGLSLVRTLTELHGGSVSAHSGGAGLGSEFIVRLPLSNEPNATAASHVPDPPARNATRHRVLIVDDNEDAAESLAMLLQAEGYDARTASDGKTGVRIADEFAAEAIILDIGLPDMTGYEVAQAVRQSQSGKSALVIALTGWGQKQDKQDAELAGCDFHFTKPVDLGRLLAILAGGSVDPAA
ncbi:ATP-binding protein [Caballeronia sordidicola]|uniref:hybrid sensor histidine kinase/response regulator n=1 Tax=Caballeronia sordidicola TaxID=196367 RepID=UPI0004D00E01|nr:ATP-binding protein [Caballeronia sordidicola]